MHFHLEIVLAYAIASGSSLDAVQDWDQLQPLLLQEGVQLALCTLDHRCGQFHELLAVIGCTNQASEAPSFWRDPSSVGEDVEVSEHLRSQKVLEFIGFMLPTLPLEVDAVIHSLCSKPVHDLAGVCWSVVVGFQHVINLVVEFAPRLQDFNPVLQELERCSSVAALGKPT